MVRTAGGFMGLWGMLFEIVKTAATHAAPHVARGAVDIARERMNANKPEPQESNAVEQLHSLLSEFDQRISTAEHRAAAAEQSLAEWREGWNRKWASARVWIIALLCWNVLLTGLIIYLVFAHR